MVLEAAIVEVDKGPVETFPVVVKGIAPIFKPEEKFHHKTSEYTPSTVARKLVTVIGGAVFPRDKIVVPIREPPSQIFTSSTLFPILPDKTAQIAGVDFEAGSPSSTPIAEAIMVPWILAPFDPVYRTAV